MNASSAPALPGEREGSLPSTQPLACVYACMAPSTRPCTRVQTQWLKGQAVHFVLLTRGP